MVLFTVGHSTRSADELLELLRAHGVQRVVDVRMVPRSRRNPQFESSVLRASLAAGGIAYEHLRALGGLRRPRPDSRNTAWRNDGFRGFADHMETPDFARALDQLLALAAERPTAVLCAEAVPWRCHRSLIADAATVRGVEVHHLLSVSDARPHRLTPSARVEDGRLGYPGEPVDGGE